MNSLKLLNDTREDRFMQRIINALPAEQQSGLSLEYAHNSITKRAAESQEREQLKREIIDEVLCRLSVMIESGEVLQKIAALEKAIDRLGQ